MHTQHIARIAFATFALLILASGPAAAKCSNATLNGVYGALSSGNSEKNSPTGGVFRLVTDGRGNVTGSGIQSDDGTIETETFNGTYSVSKDCTGTMTLIDQNNTHADYNFFFDERNNHFEFVRTDTPFNEAGEGETVGAQTCSLSKKTIFANRLREFGSFLVDIVGQVTLDGKGKATANETFVTNGTVQSAKMSGTYLLNQDCTGTITLKAGPNTYDFSMVAVNAGQTLFLIDTDPNNIDVGVANAQ